MSDRRLLTGGEAVAHAMRQIDPDVVPVYPITPQTPIIQTFAKLCADGGASTEIVNVESEHSAMSAAVGAALAGARTMTATSSQGLALMAEIVYIASSMRAPIVMAVGNRALSGPINIHCDHSDSMLVRDSGAILLFVENAQEAYDVTLLAPRLAEREDVLLPVFVCQDGFTITHSAEPVELLPDGLVRDWVGDYDVPFPLLDTDHPTTQGPFAMPDYYYELRIGSFRPFPTEAVREALRNVAHVSVLDRADSPGGPPPLFSEVAAALYGSGARLRPHVYGLGGRELHPPDVEEIFAGDVDRYVGLRSSSLV